MKIVSIIAKIMAALAAVVGGIYLLATYGEQIVAWCKKVIDSLPVCGDDDEAAVEEEDLVQAEEAAPAEEAPAEEAAEEAAQEPAAEEAPAQEPAAEEIPADAVVADESDFEG